MLNQFLNKPVGVIHIHYLKMDSVAYKYINVQTISYSILCERDCLRFCIIAKKLYEFSHITLFSTKVASEAEVF